MKKIITLLVAASFMTSAFAQYGSRNQRDGNGYGDKGKDISVNDNRFDKTGPAGGYGNGTDNSRYDDKNMFATREMNRQIDRINQEYDYKIQSVKNRFFMNRFKKEQIIYGLEAQRKQEIKQVYERFMYAKRGYNDHDNDRHW